MWGTPHVSGLPLTPFTAQTSPFRSCTVSHVLRSRVPLHERSAGKLHLVAARKVGHAVPSTLWWKGHCGQAMEPGCTFPGRRRSGGPRVPLLCAEWSQGGGDERVAQSAEGLCIE